MIEIRNCAGFDELEACVQLEIDTWGYEQSEIIPRKGFYIAQRIGGQVMGAFDTEIPASAAGGDAHRLIGFVMALTGAKTAPGQTPTPYLHSHMLAVRPAYRNQGLGARLPRQRLQLKSAFRFRPASTSGRPRLRIASALWPCNRKTVISFSSHFPAG